MKKKLHYLFVLLLVLSLGSCAKDGSDGPIGPDGKEGREGREGLQGAEGKQGVPGTDGNMIYYGSRAPTASIGKEGDFYIDKATSNLYGPKTPTSWGAGSSMKGAQGDKGNTGAAGKDGAQGDKGNTGAAGKDGAKGDKGDAGTAGKDGTKGDKGDAGTAGKDGTKGDKGETGAAGSQFLSGPADPSASIGKDGDYYFNISTGTLFGPKASNWAAGINLKGLKGDKGDRGERGPAGLDGQDGNANVFSTEWTTFPQTKWATTLGVGPTLFREPGDKASLVVPYAFTSNKNYSFDGVVLVYVDDDRAIRIPPFSKFVNISGVNLSTDFRIVMSDFNGTKYIHLVAASKTIWSAAEETSAKVELAKLKFKLVVIPPSIAQAKASAMKQIDLNDLNAVTQLFDLKN